MQIFTAADSFSMAAFSILGQIMLGLPVLSADHLYKRIVPDQAQQNLVPDLDSQVFFLFEEANNKNS